MQLLHREIILLQSLQMPVQAATRLRCLVAIRLLLKMMERWSLWKNGVGETGTYTQKPSHEGEAAKLDIEFNSEPLEELNKNWQVDLISPDAIHLSDDGNASEVLQFTAE